MKEIVVAFAPEDQARGDAVVAALRRSGAQARPGDAQDQADLVLWSRHAARRRLTQMAARSALIARLDETPPPPGAKAYRAADLRAWRGAVRQPAWRSLVRKLPRAAAPAPALAPAPAPTPAPVAARPPAPAPKPPPPKRPGALTLIVGALLLIAAAWAGAALLLL